MKWEGVSPEQMARLLRKAAAFLGFPMHGPWGREAQAIICECIIGNPDAEGIWLTDDLRARAKAAREAEGLP